MTDNTTPTRSGFADPRLLVRLDVLWDAVDLEGGNLNKVARNALKQIEIGPYGNPSEAKATHVGHLFQIHHTGIAGRRKNLKHVRNIARASVEQIKQHLLSIGLKLDRIDGDMVAWLEVPFDGTLPEGLRDEPPITKQELHAMLEKAKKALPAAPVTEAEQQSPIFEHLTPAQRELLAVQEHVIVDIEALAMAQEIRATNVIDIGANGRASMASVAIAIATLGDDAPPFILVTRRDIDKPVKAIITERSDRNIALLGIDPKSIIDINANAVTRGYNLVVAGDATQEAPLSFTSEHIEAEFVITGNEEVLARNGFGPRVVITRLHGFAAGKPTAGS